MSRATASTTHEFSIVQVPANESRASDDPVFYDVAVLAGGDSAESEISLASGQQVAAALKRAGHHATLIDPAHVDLFSINWREIDVCFIALHGGAGENGSIQLQLEEIGIPYTGSSPIASRIAMSKAAAKERFVQYNLPTPAWKTIHAGAESSKIVSDVSAIGFPVVIKPDSQGSSLGVSVVRGPDDIAEAVEKSRQYDSFLVAERYIEGRELTVAVLDGQPLPTLEIKHGQPLFDFETKISLEADSVVPLDESEAFAVRAAKAAAEAAESLGTRGLVRVDLMVDAAGDPWVLEVNTVPGLTSKSLVPQAAELSGFGFSGMCDHMVRSAVAAEMLV